MEQPPPSTGVPLGCRGSGCLWDPPTCPSPGSVNCDELLHSQLCVPRTTGKPRPARAVPSITEGVVEPAWLPAAPQPWAVVALWSPSSWGSAGQGCWLGSASPLHDSHGREADWDRPVGASSLSCREGMLPSDWWHLIAGAGLCGQERQMCRVLSISHGLYPRPCLCRIWPPR